MASKESSSRTLWVGDVEHWMDEEFLHRCFSPIGSVTNIKLVRRTNLPSSGGFAFVEFADRAPVADAVDRLEGRAFHALGFNFRVNWAQFSVNDSNLANRNGSGASRGTEYSIYVGGLDFAVKDHDLLNAFMSRYPSAFQAKVICDQRTQFSRGFGFVRFREQREAEEAIREMQGVFIGSKAIKVKQANRSQEPHRDSTPWTVAPPPCPMVPVIDSMAVTTVLCISQLDAATPQDLQQLLQRCAAFGAVLRHVFVEASCFVEFQESTAAEAAASHLAGECGLSVHFSDSATVEYYRSLQLEGWLPAFQPVVAITNLTTIKAEQALQRDLEPGMEHFKVLLKDPRFKRIFEQILRQQGKAEDCDWSVLLQDKPELFARPPAELVAAQNADLTNACGGLRTALGLATLPEGMRLGLC